MNTVDKQRFFGELQTNLRQNILPYWIDRMSDPRGGFYGRRDGCDRLDPDAPKGAILHARILWTFAAAYRRFGDPAYLAAAKRAARYLIDRFIDREQGGVYWSLRADGTPLETKKQFYALGFAIYGLAEYHRATDDEEALREAIALFRTIEARSRDRVRGGYVEALTRDWQPIPDMRLSEKDRNASKTMNTHLHVIEAYTNLLRVWPSRDLHAATAELLDLFFDRIEDPATHHLGLFFDDDWRRVDAGVSYGHDIEASWLLLETAQLLGDSGRLERAMRHTAQIAEAALRGRQDDGSMVYEVHDDGRADNDRHWWVQAECVVGLLYGHAFHGRTAWLDAAWETWRYIAAQLVDAEAGEWYWSRRADGSVNRTDDKAGFWKCPYHNSRMCLEAMQLLERR